jgi:hypothetical protein
MRDAQQPTTAYYRKISREIKELASRAELPEVRRDMLELAERFDRMAAYVEKRYPNGRDKLPPQARPGDA